MATYIEAYTRYGPRISLGARAGGRQLTGRLSDTTGQHRGEVMRVLYSLNDALVHFNQAGRIVEIPGIGSFQPTLKGDGRIRVRYRPDREYLSALDDIQRFEGEVLNRQNIGLTPADYKALWDAEHPGNAMALPALVVGVRS